MKWPARKYDAREPDHADWEAVVASVRARLHTQQQRTIVLLHDMTAVAPSTGTR